MDEKYAHGLNYACELSETAPVSVTKLLRRAY